MLNNTYLPESQGWQAGNGSESSRRLQDTKVTDAGLAQYKDGLNLAHLYLDNTDVTDAGLAHLKHCTGIADFGLNHTQVGDASLELLAGFIKLTRLDLQNCRVSRYGYDQLKAGLPNCQLDWSELNRSVAEKALALGGQGEIASPGKNDVRPVNSADLLPPEFFQVRRISLKAVNKPLDEIVSTMSELRFSNFDRLEDVTLVGSSLTDEQLARFSKLPQLRRLVLDDNPIRGHGMVHLQALPELAELSLNCPTITDLLAKNLAELKQLKRLSLVGANLSDAGIRHLETLTNLTALDLRKTKATAEGIERLQKTLPNCKIEWELE